MATFHPFMRLPSELRIKIWRYNFPGPRVVAVRYARGQNRYVSDRAPPVLLHVSSESRSVFLSTYEALILSPSHDSSVFIDFERDTLFFDHLNCSPRGDLALDLASSPQRDKIIQCAIDAQLWEVLRVFRHDSMSEIRFLRNLKTVALVLRHDHDRLRQSRTSNHGAVYVQVDSDTVASEIRHVNWYVESLKTELNHEVEPKWLNGKPSVQTWIW
ncbi:hypothetical protein GLAREA_00591 [Glarea lozoyensis ATCC 20868]|uniref:2EXR domain-containing protein n=1 Tax=Glarea lozoyensis (strain ATCC 20868 / MF5171) TaxID=1116229 RepID=S3DBT3_GLAL2|nr:uncharacterized protein GLAREA_00591 [Glarea lozoyensis ATCC 20868]EPE29431.1 hypothetical protein GLAREA_00591 [Glarea lozoyensis ATCC 20868]